MVLNRQSRVRVALPPLERFLARVRKELRLNGREVSVCLVSDGEIARMNRKYRGKPKPTDVLSFPAPSNGVRKARGDARAAFYLGDIAISPETARRNARRSGRALSEGLRILILHGILHLMGYDHETDGGRMDRVEARVRWRLGLN
jgi:probable rRNA maturation factor